MADVPEEIKDFLYTQVENIDRLRILLLMHKEPQDWRVETLSARLYILPEKVSAELENLRDRGIIELVAPGAYRYLMESPHHAYAEELARMDKEKPVTLINLLYQPSDRLKSFADAFKLKKKEP